LFDKKIVVWRWDKPSKIFEPTASIFYKGITFKSHNKCVHAGLTPLDWTGFGKVLHKIVLDKQQAKQCVVAEGCFIPSYNELSDFAKKRQMGSVGILRYYQNEKYEKSFVPLLEYSGHYNQPEVLIPFPVKANVISYARILILMWKLMIRIKKRARLMVRLQPKLAESR
jgi:hypothetical protein